MDTTSRSDRPEGRGDRTRRVAPPLDAAALDRLALRYVERFQTTEARLSDYLKRKVRERGWAPETPADPAGVAARMTALGYVDDRAYAEAKASALTRRGLGARRVTGALRAAGIAGEEVERLAPELAERALAGALDFARRKRIGPFAAAPADRPTAQRQLGQMLRAGHGVDLSRRIIRLEPGETIDLD